MPLLFSAYMENVFIFLGVLLILFGLYLVYEAAKWLSYVRRRAGTDPGFFSPRTAVLCPCKGVEPGLERNLTALCEFDHQNYEVFFVLASESDPAASIVKRVASQAHGKGHVVFPGRRRIVVRRFTICAPQFNNCRKGSRFLYSPIPTAGPDTHGCAA